MDNDTVVKVESVSKKYCLDLRKSIQYGVIDVLNNIFWRNTKTYKLRPDEFWALDNISFEVKRGETLGIIGPNGSGKTTLLKLMSGIILPDKGKITIKGKIGTLIEIGAGFHPMLSGKENIYISGSIHGMSKKEIDSKFNSIVSFANIGEFLNWPVKTYSSGMFIRLGFAIAVHCEPDILLVDEVLSVGDLSFQMKCYNKIKEMLRKCAVIIVSHNLYSIQSLVGRTIWINKGLILAEGEPRQIIDAYVEDVNLKSLQGIENEPDISEANSLVRITEIRLLKEDNAISDRFVMHGTLKINIRFFAEKKVENIRFGVGVLTSDGIPVSSIGGLISGEILIIERGEGEVEYKLEKLALFPRGYYLIVSILNENGHTVYSQRRNCCHFIVKPPDNFMDTITRDRGIVHLEHTFEKIY